MSDTTIVAVVILGGVFLLMGITVIKGGIEAAVKMWGVMGALTGVAFGSITSYYFTNMVKNQEVAAVSAEKAEIETQLASATADASKARELVLPVYSALRGDPKFAATYPASYDFVANLPKDERDNLAARFSTSDTLLKSIELQGAATAAAAAASPP